MERISRSCRIECGVARLLSQPPITASPSAAEVARAALAMLAASPLGSAGAAVRAADGRASGARRAPRRAPISLRVRRPNEADRDATVGRRGPTSRSRAPDRAPRRRDPRAQPAVTGKQQLSIKDMHCTGSGPLFNAALFAFHVRYSDGHHDPDRSPPTAHVSRCDREPATTGQAQRPLPATVTAGAIRCSRTGTTERR